MNLNPDRKQKLGRSKPMWRRTIKQKTKIYEEAVVQQGKGYKKLVWQVCFKVGALNTSGV